MWRAVKALDLKRDPRFALHSASIDPEAGWSGDAKVAGTVEVIEDGGRIAQVLQGNGRHAPKGPMHLFRAELREVVHVHLNEDHTKLVIDSWHEGQGMRTRSR